jgi:hypothetical protein
LRHSTSGVFALISATAKAATLKSETLTGQSAPDAGLCFLASAERQLTTFAATIAAMSEQSPESAPTGRGETTGESQSSGRVSHSIR